MIYYYCQEGWETKKDHPIRRARDLKPVQFVVAHLKTPFFITFMIEQPFKTTIKEKLTLAANNYSKLINKKIIIASNDFEYAESYVIRFYKTNFLHLTGVKTELSAEHFFEKCLAGSLFEEEFDCDSTDQRKGLVRLKMKHLININTFFNQLLMVQENYGKNAIKCVVATSDGKCTIGFADAKYCVRPKTILDKNHLKKDQKIINVTPNIKSL